MNKREAAEYLGKTERAVERYTEAGKLSVRYKPGKTRPVADYDKGELAKLKHDLDNPSDVRPAIVSETPTNDEQPRTTPTQALQRAASPQTIEALGQAIAGALQGAQTHGNAVVDVPLRDKLTLSFKEAARLSGVPESHLRAAYSDGKLRGAKIGRGVRVTPDDVRKYVAARMKAKK